MSIFDIFKAKRALAQQAALEYANRYGLRGEVEYCLEHGYSPEEALLEWDLLTPEIIEILHGYKDS